MSEVVEQKFKSAADVQVLGRGAAGDARPDPKAKFEAGAGARGGRHCDWSAGRRTSRSPPPKRSRAQGWLCGRGPYWRVAGGQAAGAAKIKQKENKGKSGFETEIQQAMTELKEVFIIRILQTRFEFHSRIKRI